MNCPLYFMLAPKTTINNLTNTESEIKKKNLHLYN